MAKNFSDKNWKWFGFLGEPEPGHDYSWIEVQNNLNFVGNSNSIPCCTIYFSSRRPNLILVRTEDDVDTVWDIGDLFFSFVGNSNSILEASDGHRICQIFGVTQSFIGLLMKFQKLPLDSLQNMSPSPPQKITILQKKTQHIPTPKDAIKPIEHHNETVPVTLTGALNGQEFIKGELTFEDNTLKIGSDWSLEFSNIKSITNTQADQFYLLFLTKEEKRYEIAFEKSNIPFANNIVEMFQSHQQDNPKSDFSPSDE